MLIKALSPNSPLPLGEGLGVRACSPLPLGEGPGVRVSPRPVGEGLGVRVSPRPATGVQLPSPVLGEGSGVRASPRPPMLRITKSILPHPQPWTLALFENARFLLQTGTNSCRFGEYL